MDVYAAASRIARPVATTIDEVAAFVDGPYGGPGAGRATPWAAKVRREGVPGTQPADRKRYGRVADGSGEAVAMHNRASDGSPTTQCSARGCAWGCFVGLDRHYAAQRKRCSRVYVGESLDRDALMQQNFYG